MNYIYAIICHKITNPLIFTVNQLLKSDKSKVIIHIDAKTNLEESEKIYSSLGEHKNLYFIPKESSINVKWGNFSQIEVMLLLMNKALEYDFKYFSLISGDDLPISSNKDRESFFEDSYTKAIEFIGVNYKNNAYDRLCINYPDFFFKKDHSLFAKIKRELYVILAKKINKKDISHLPPLYKGSNWFSLTDKTIKYIFNYVNKNPEYLKSFKHSLCGDEVFFQTIIFNNLELRKNIYGIESNLPDCTMGGRYIDWTTGPDFPRTLDENDIEKISTSNLLFARKFKYNVSFSLLNKIIEK